jgi:CRP-like cAMP-binding protein
VDFAEVWRMAEALQDVVPIFTLSEEERREIVSHMRVRRFGADEIVYRQGDGGQDLLVVHTGHVESVLEGAYGEELIVGLYGRGQFLGELELFNDTPGRMTTVRAVEATTALQIARDDALRVLRRNAEAMYFLSRRVFALYGRLRHTTAGIAFGDAHSRVADALVELNIIGDRGPVPLTQAKIAAAAGVSERTFRRILAEFARRGLIDVVGRRQIRVIDQARLEAEIQAILPEEGRADFTRRLGDVFIPDA